MANRSPDKPASVTWLDALLSLVLAGLMASFLLAGGSPEGEWKPSLGNTLFGLNVIAWGIAFALAYRFPQDSLLLRGLASLAKLTDGLGPLKFGQSSALIWAAFLLFAGALMLITGAGWA